MRQLSVVAFMLMVTSSLPAVAYTQGDVEACTPDAMRLCSQAIPDERRVVLCLVANKRQLSPACTVVFNRARAANVSRERPANAEQPKF